MLQVQILLSPKQSHVHDAGERRIFSALVAARSGIATKIVSCKIGIRTARFVADEISRKRHPVYGSSLRD